MCVIVHIFSFVCVVGRLLQNNYPEEQTTKLKIIGTHISAAKSTPME